MNHIGFIPARKGSQRFKFKNRLFFDFTADFIDKTNWFSKVIVSTDDPVIKKFSEDRNYELHHRPDKLAGPAVSIKEVFSNVIKTMKISNNDILWLFYLPILYKDPIDFQECKSIIEKKEVKSLCSFIPVKTHPYTCWMYDSKKKLLEQYAKNEVFRFQDFPPAWEHHHYLYCFKPSELSKLSHEMLNSRTYPVFLDKDKAQKLVEIDTPEEYERWKKKE